MCLIFWLFFSFYVVAALLFCQEKNNRENKGELWDCGKVTKRSAVDLDVFFMRVYTKN